MKPGANGSVAAPLRPRIGPAAAPRPPSLPAPHARPRLASSARKWTQGLDEMPSADREKHCLSSDCKTVTLAEELQCMRWLVSASSAQDTCSGLRDHADDGARPDLRS